MGVDDISCALKNSSAAEFVLPTSEWLRGMRSRLDKKAPKPRLLPLRSNVQLDFEDRKENKVEPVRPTPHKGPAKKDVLDYSKWDKILAPALESVSAEEIDTNYRHALVAESHGEFLLAEEFYERLMETGTENATIICRYGNLLFHKLKKKEQGEHFLSQAASLSVDPEILRHYAFALSQKGDSQAAANTLKKALLRNPTSADVYCDYGVEALRDNELGSELAEDSFRRALELDPGHMRTLYNYGCFLYEKGDYSSTERLFKRALLLEPSNTLVLGEYGSLLAANNPQRSIGMFSKALSIDPSNRRALLGYGIVLGTRATSEAEKDQAEALFRKSLKCHPQDAESLTNLAAFLACQRREHGEARSLYQKAERLQPNHVPTLCDFGCLLKDEFQDFEGASDLFERALDLSPGHVMSLRGYAELKIARARDGRDLEDAKTLLKRALRVNPHDADTLACLGGLLREGDSSREVAGLMLDKAIKIQPDHVTSLCQKGILLSSKGQFADAEIFFQRALHLVPNHLEAMLGQANILSVPPAGLPNSTIDDEYKETVRTFDRGGQVMRGMLDEVVQERFQRSARMFERALSLVPDYVPALCGYGKVLYQLDDREGSERALRRALRMDPHDWRTLANYGVLLVRTLGDTFNGEKMLTDAIRHAPEHARGELNDLKNQVLQLGEEKVSDLRKNAERARWESRWSNADSVNAPYDGRKFA